jgi:hypothetical protein
MWERILGMARGDAGEPGEPNLRGAVARQVSRYIELGFHRELGMNKAEYRARFELPQGVNQLEVDAGRFDIPLVVDPEVGLSRQAVLGGIRVWRNFDIRWVEDLTEVPREPYLGFTHDGQRYRPYPIKRAMELFEADEVGSPLAEVIALCVQHPECFEGGLGVYAAGSLYPGDFVPRLSQGSIDAGWIGDEMSGKWGALSRGREIIRLGV